MTRGPWSLVDAVALINDLLPDAQAAGWGLGLHGSVLYRGASAHDLDVIAYPMDTSKPLSIDSLHAVLIRHALKITMTREYVHDHWREKGSTDTKHVEIWHTAEKPPRRVDLFVLR